MTMIIVQPSGTEIEIDPDDTVLAGLQKAGYACTVGCKRGGCGVCKVQLLAGEVRYERPIADSVLSDDERVEGICLSCRAVPLTNVVIELQEGDKLRRVLGFVYPNTSTKGQS